MPKGNDTKANLVELTDQFGEGVGRAEDLVAAAQAAYPAELREAQLQPKDEEASAEADWAKAAKATDVKKADIVDVSIRGAYVIVAYEDDDGRVHKAWGEASDVVDKELLSREARTKARKKAESDNKKS